VNDSVEKGIREKLAEFVPAEKTDEAPDYKGLLNWMNVTFPIGLTEKDAKFETRDYEGNAKFLCERVLQAYDLKTQGASPQALQEIEKMILLNAIDRLWQEHLYALDALKEGVGLRSYGQKDPLIEFKQEAFTIFAELMHNINGEVLGNLFRSTQQLAAFEQFLAQVSTMRTQQRSEPSSITSTGDPSDGGDAPPPESSAPRLIIPTPAKRDTPKVGRNDPCPCGSGKKYKACCGRVA
jgi:preprotein translocase subunit SecA